MVTARDAVGVIRAMAVSVVNQWTEGLPGMIRIDQANQSKPNIDHAASCVVLPAAFPAMHHHLSLYYHALYCLQAYIVVKYKDKGPLDLVAGPGGLDTTWAQVRLQLSISFLLLQEVNYSSSYLFMQYTYYDAHFHARSTKCG